MAMLLPPSAMPEISDLSIHWLHQLGERTVTNDKLQIRLNPEQKERLLQIAEAHGVTQTDVIKDAIAEQWFRLNIAEKDK